MTTIAATRRPVRSRLAATALAATTALLAAAPAASAIEWVQGPEIASPRAFLSTGEIAPDGTTTAAWLEVPENLSDPGGLKLRQAASDGTLGPIQTLEAAVIGDPGMDVAVNGAGAAVVVWTGLVAGPEIPLRIAPVGAGGALGPVRTVAGIPSSGFGSWVRAAVDDGGTTTIVWTGEDPGSGDQGVMSMRVGADGSASVPLLLARTGNDPSPAVAVTPGGIAWVAWTDDDLDADDIYAVRLGADGRPDGAPEQVSDDEGTAVPPALSASPAGAVVSWLRPTGCCDELAAAGRTLQPSGPLLGTSLRSDTAFEPAEEAPFPAAIGPDGTVSFVVPRVADAGGGFLPVASQPQLERFAPGAGSPTVTPLAPASSDSAVASTAVGAGPDGSLLVTWSEFSASLQSSLKGTRVTPDGQVGPVVSADGIGGVPLLPIPGLAGGQLPRPDLGGGGTVLSTGLRLTVVEGTPVPLQTLRALTYDVTPPAVSIVAPASAATAAAVQFSADVRDRTAVRLRWDFGDESESGAAAPRHRFAQPGTYTVTVTARDAAGNESTARQAIAIATPPSPPPAPPAPVPAPAARTAAALRLTSATRRGSKVTVAGTIARGASGRVTIVYAQRLGRRTVTARTTARIARGRWRATVTLRGALARARRGARVTVTYGGDARVDAATASGAVRTASAPRGARRKSKGKARKR